MDHYLANDASGEYTAQLTRLLRDEATDNCHLLLEIISGGGVNRRLKGYLFGIAANHINLEVHKRAHQLLARYAEPDTVKQVEKLRESRGYYFDEAGYLGRFESKEIDIFDFLLAFRMCNWHRNADSRSEYRRSLLSDLDLTYYKADYLTESIQTLDFVRNIDLPAHRSFDVAAAVPLLKHLPVEVLRIEDVKMDFFPVEVFELANLRKFSIKRRGIRPRHPMRVPEGGPFASETLEYINVDSYPIVGTERLGVFPKLKEAYFNRCNLDDVAFLQHSPLLNFIELRHNQLTEVPLFLSEMQELLEITLKGNPFERIEFHPGQLKKLRKYQIES